MTLSANRNKDGSVRRRYFWCKKRVCRKKVGFQLGTFSKRGILKPTEVFNSFYCWTQVRMPLCNQLALDMRQETGSTIISGTVVSYSKALRDVCVSYFNGHPVKLGGPGKVVKIDETVLTRKKLIKEGLFHISGVLK